MMVKSYRHSVPGTAKGYATIALPFFHSLGQRMGKHGIVATLRRISAKVHYVISLTQKITDQSGLVLEAGVIAANSNFHSYKFSYYFCLCMEESNLFILRNSHLSLRLSRPGCYYKGVRFDWGGVWRSISLDGQSFSDLWFDGGDSFTHDHLTGPSEEFQTPSGYDGTPLGGTFLKVGVGLLQKTHDAPYDRFQYYPIADGGHWRVLRGRSTAVFIHKLSGHYIYMKVVRITRSNSFRISHFLKNTGKDRLQTEQYNHNFFTFSLNRVGKERSIEWGFPIEGHWREDSVNAFKTEKSIGFSSEMQPGQKAYIGDVTATEEYDGGYSFRIKASDKEVSVRSNRKMSKAVFWSNHRICCAEPYIPIDIAPGKSFSWNIDYTLSCHSSGE